MLVQITFYTVMALWLVTGVMQMRTIRKYQKLAKWLEKQFEEEHTDER